MKRALFIIFYLHQHCRKIKNRKLQFREQKVCVLQTSHIFLNKIMTLIFQITHI